MFDLDADTRIYGTAQYAQWSWNTSHFRLGLFPVFQQWELGKPKKGTSDADFIIHTPWIYFIYWKEDQLGEQDGE